MIGIYTVLLNALKRNIHFYPVLQMWKWGHTPTGQITRPNFRLCSPCYRKSVCK